LLASVAKEVAGPKLGIVMLLLLGKVMLGKVVLGVALLAIVVSGMITFLI
jgi:hypothetical protein